MPSKVAVKEKVYQLKINLKGSKPPIWRRVLVTGDTSLHELHLVIQAAMGWTDSHLHQFVIDRTCYGKPDSGDMEVKNEVKSLLGQFRFRPKDRFVYEYDFGDSWDHVLFIGDRDSGAEAWF